jgi:type II secretory pathway pseudopilin PulG
VGAGKYKLGSALYSLYSALPRTFQFNESSQANAASLTAIAQRQLDKLAIITVSSRKCDVNAKTPEAYQATIYGEVIGIERLPNGYVRVGTLSTFSSNQASNEMYERPEAILEQVKACYAKGYRHFLYVARAPYSSTLHISDVGSEEELFFMNKTVIQAIRDANPESRVYPVFCDTYYVVNQRRRSRTAQQVDSLYIDDIGELSTLVNDPSKRSLVFFNLFNGANVNKQVYNGVMSYSTLLNVYENDPTYDQYIWSNILGEKSPQSLKTDILDFITLLHFSRYEKPRDLRFKLDPYKRVIGDMSVGKVAIFPNMKGSVHFNSLAFLTLVRAVLHAK